MARRKSTTLTQLELEIMQELWLREETTVEDLAAAFTERGTPLSPPSFRTMLSILCTKGYVTRRRVGRGYAYRARVPAEDARKSMLTDLIQRAFDGSASALVTALVKHGMMQRDDLEKARRLIAKVEKGENQ